MKVGVVIMSDLRSRLNKILDLHGEALSEAVNLREPNSQEARLSVKDLILRFAGSDPTDGKSRTQWLVKTYIKDDQFKLEDLGRVDAALAAFERFKRKLPVEQRELSRFKSLRTLEELVDPFVKAEAKARLERDLSTVTGRELRRLEELKARDESIIIQEEEGLPTIAVPMTEFASCWWGRGTKWCTAAEKNNAFQEYNTDAPLVIIVCPDGAKFQMNVKKDDFQFRDNTDKTVSREIIEERWNEFQSLFYWAIEQNGLILQHIPEEYRTPELCRLAVEQYGLALYYVPGKYQTPELYRLAVEQDGHALRHVPEHKRTHELCWFTVERNGLALRHVPKKHRTSELYHLAIEQNGLALGCIPEEEKTFELCRLAVEHNGEALAHVPSRYKTSALCDTAIQQSGLTLYAVPETYRTLKLCRLAVEQNGGALHHVPENHKTPELCRIAVEQDGITLDDVPKKYRTLELCRIAVSQNGRALYHVPENKRSLKLCRIAVEQDGDALYYIPENKRTPELCRLAIQQNGLALRHVPEKYRTPELMALITPVQPKWTPDILQGLGQHSEPSYKSACPVQL
jgi:hypothetical protein